MFPFQHILVEKQRKGQGENISEISLVLIGSNNSHLNLLSRIFFQLLVEYMSLSSGFDCPWSSIDLSILLGDDVEFSDLTASSLAVAASFSDDFSDIDPGLSSLTLSRVCK